MSSAMRSQWPVGPPQSMDFRSGVTEAKRRRTDLFATSPPTRSFANSFALIRLRSRKLHHLRPLLRLFGDELAKVGGRTREHHAAHIDELLLDLRIGETC